MDSGCRRCGRHGSALPRAAPAPWPAPASPPGAPRTLRGAARRSLCECVRGVCAPAAPSRAAGVTAALSGRRARRSARRPMAGRLISRGVLWRCPGCMALCGAAFRGRRGEGVALRAASGPAARCAPRRGECPGPPARTGRAEMGSGRQGGREREGEIGRGVPSPHALRSAPQRRGSPPRPSCGSGGQEGGAELPLPGAAAAAALSHFSSLLPALPSF